MVRNILSCVICSIFLCYSAISKAADQTENYCPEEDFVRICLAPVMDEAGFRDWIETNNWTLQDFPDRLLKNYSSIRMYERDLLRGRFRRSVLEFSDVTEISCHFDTATFVFMVSPRICDLNFPLITEKLGSSITPEKVSENTARTKTWEYKTESSRGFVTVALDKSGRVFSFWATKYIFK